MENDMAKKSKADKIWAYKVKHPQATTREVATATKTSYNYVYKLMSKIGTPQEVLEDYVYEMTKHGVPKTDYNADLNPSGVSRADILDTAKEYVTKDRAADHGDMEDNFSTIGAYWSVHLGVKVDATDVAVMMTLLKAARIKSNPKHPDNWIDGCGYLSCGGELASK
tara:strand:- start:393 stop:893 length:501 start_codon:yes stop_codon:yes gene_type:complete